MTKSGAILFFNPARLESIKYIFFADVHRPQKTVTVKKVRQANKTILAKVSSGCICKVSINKLFKDFVPV